MEPYERAAVTRFGMPGREILAALDVSEADIERVMRAWQAEKRARAGWMRIFPGIEKTLDGLRARGATSRHRHLQAPGDLRAGLFALWAGRVLRPSALPAPTPPCTSRTRSRCLKFLERAGARPSEALYVGDSVYDRDCARAAGVDFALATWGSAPAGDGERHLAPQRAGRPAGNFGYIKNAGRAICSSRDRALTLRVCNLLRNVIFGHYDLHARIGCHELLQA